MSAPLMPAPEQRDAVARDLLATMQALGRAARTAAATLAEAPRAAKDAALTAAAAALRAERPSILQANARDLAGADSRGLSASQRDRLLLTEARVEDMASGLEQIAVLADPVGESIAEWSRPNGLRIRRVRVPLGVIGIIYESRP